MFAGDNVVRPHRFLRIDLRPVHPDASGTEPAKSQFRRPRPDIAAGVDRRAAQVVSGLGVLENLAKEPVRPLKATQLDERGGEVVGDRRRRP